MSAGSAIRTVTKRELAAYFDSPVAYVFIVIFLLLSSAFTFYLGGFYERGQADLQPFFTFHPWLYLFLMPALSMRLWAEERKSGTIELLLTLPITLWQAVLGKFLAAWCFAAIALALTFPLWLTVNYLGDPDNGVIVAAYLGSLLMAGGFLAIGACLSAATRSQVIAFILTVVVCLAFLLSGFPLVLDVFSAWAPQSLVDAIAALSFLSHFEAISKGVLDLRDLLLPEFELINDDARRLAVLGTLYVYSKNLYYGNQEVLFEDQDKMLQFIKLIKQDHEFQLQRHKGDQIGSKTPYYVLLSCRDVAKHERMLLKKEPDIGEYWFAIYINGQPIDGELWEKLKLPSTIGGCEKKTSD